MQLKFSGKTDIGQRRKVNQDSIYMDGKLRLFIIADGMGGHKGGEVASKMACEALSRVVKSGEEGESPETLLIKAFKQATSNVYLEAEKPGGEDLKGMGTTMVALLVRGEDAYLANVGDSRAYLQSKDGSLWRLTEDHSLVNEGLRSGLIQEEGLAEAKGKNVITRSVGFAPEVRVDVLKRKLQVGERYMLCSDGLYGMVSDEGIQKFLVENPKASLEVLVTELISAANRNGGDDNVSCLFVSVE